MTLVRWDVGSIVHTISEKLSSKEEGIILLEETTRQSMHYTPTTMITMPLLFRVHPTVLNLHGRVSDLDIKANAK